MAVSFETSHSIIDWRPLISFAVKQRIIYRASFTSLEMRLCMNCRIDVSSSLSL